MAITYKGNTTVFGANGTDDITGFAYRKQQDFSYSANHPTFMLKDTIGQVVGIGNVEIDYDLEVTFVPIATSAANALTALTEPAAIAKVTIASYDDTTINGDYHVVSIRKVGNNEAPQRYTLTLKQFPNVNLSQAIT